MGCCLRGGANGAATRMASNIVAKRWPVESYIELAERLAAEGVDVLVLGGPGELAVREVMEERAPSRAHVLIGQTSLAATMALMKRCKAIVTNDSGPMHIADALGVRTIAVFGPTDPRVVGPYGQPQSVLRAREGCCPCFDETVFPNRVPECSHQRCMHSVSVDRVFSEVLQVIGAGACR